MHATLNVKGHQVSSLGINNTSDNPDQQYSTPERCMEASGFPPASIPRAWQEAGKSSYKHYFAFKSWLNLGCSQGHAVSHGKIYALPLLELTPFVYPVRAREALQSDTPVRSTSVGKHLELLPRYTATTNYWKGLPQLHVRLWAVSYLTPTSSKTKKTQTKPQTKPKIKLTQKTTADENTPEPVKPRTKLAAPHLDSHNEGPRTAGPLHLPPQTTPPSK